MNFFHLSCVVFSAYTNIYTTDEHHVKSDLFSTISLLFLYIFYRYACGCYTLHLYLNNLCSCATRIYYTRTNILYRDEKSKTPHRSIYYLVINRIVNYGMTAFVTHKCCLKVHVCSVSKFNMQVVTKLLDSITLTRIDHLWKEIISLNIKNAWEL